MLRSGRCRKNLPLCGLSFLRLPSISKLEWLVVFVIVAVLVLLLAQPTPHWRETSSQSCHLCGNCRVVIQKYRWWGHSFLFQMVTFTNGGSTAQLLARGQKIGRPTIRHATKTVVSHGHRSAAQHGFCARPRLRLWSIIWFADSFAPLSRFGLQRRGHRLFGNVVSFW